MAQRKTVKKSTTVGKVTKIEAGFIPEGTSVNMPTQPVDEIESVEEAIEIEQPKVFGKIILLQDVAGQKRGTIIPIHYVDKYDNVVFTLNNAKTYFNNIERGKLWDFFNEE